MAVFLIMAVDQIVSIFPRLLSFFDLLHPVCHSMSSNFATCYHRAVLLHFLGTLSSRRLSESRYYLAAYHNPFCYTANFNKMFSCAHTKPNGGWNAPRISMHAVEKFWQARRHPAGGACNPHSRDYINKGVCNLA